MATTTKLTASNGYYGHSGSGQYTEPSANHLYVGKNSGTSNYRSRVTIPAIGSIAEIGSDRIRITKLLLYIRRNDGGPTAVTVGCSQSSAWDAQADAEVTQTLKANSDDYQTIDLTDMAAYVAEYPSRWYLHFSAGSPRIRLDSTGRTQKPYLMVTWEKAAATISGDRDSAVLGADPVTFTIRPEAEGETHTLTYSIGDSSGVIAEQAGDSVVWTPPLSIASEIPDDDSAAVEIGMTAYDAQGNVQRTEVYYQTVTVPESVKPKIDSMGIQAVNALSGYLLSGRTSLKLAPVIDMTGGYGASIRSLSATVTGGQSIQWTALEETGPGIFTAPAAQTGVLPEGNVTIEITAADSRGRTAIKSQTYAVQPYSPPAITGFSVQRWELLYDENETVVDAVASDVGRRIWVNLSAQKANVPASGTDLNALSWTIIGESADGRTISASYEGTGIHLPLEKDITVFVDEVGEDEAWTFTATVTDAAGSSAVQYSTVAPGHAAFSISPDKWGAAIGMVSKATKARPRFEVAEKYESRFYGPAYDRDGAELTGGTAEIRLKDELSADEISVPSKTNTDTAIFTAEKPGLYLACISERWAGHSTGYRSIALMKGNALYARVRQAAGGSEEIQQSLCAVIPLQAGEAITRRAYQDSGAELKFVERIYQFARIGGAMVIEDPGEIAPEVPEYWQSYIAAKAAEINAALSSAGSSRSVFLWYTDAHWTTNYGTSPVLLEYLSENTGMEKTFFGGDIAVAKTGEIEIMQAWQEQVGRIPNHHSVMGNHDFQTEDLPGSPTTYAGKAAFFLDPEYSSDVVYGTNEERGKAYYYIDNQAEKTRYICLSTGKYETRSDEIQWCINALNAAPENWHIIVISHMWLNSEYHDDGTAALITTPPDYVKCYLDMFDAYNARLSGADSYKSNAYDFTQAKAKVEFIIGGHIHQDYDFATDNGIPVILTECDSWQERDDASSASEGTTSESCVYAVVADYAANSVMVLNVGRGKTRAIVIPELGTGGDPEPVGYTNWLKHVVAADGSVSEGTNYLTGTRISVSGGDFENRSETGWCATGLIPAASGDIIRLKNCTFSRTNAQTGSHRGGVYGANADGSYSGQMVSMNDMVAATGTANPVYDADGDNIVQFSVPKSIGSPGYIRFVAQQFTADSILTVNEEIE